MSKLIIDFQHDDVMQPKPWPVTIDENNDATSGLGNDDGARLVGFGESGSVGSALILPEDARKDPASVIGLVPTFSTGTGLFWWQHAVRGLTVVEA